MLRKIGYTILALGMSATALPAQKPALRPEIRPFGGATIATGAQRDVFSNAPQFGVQGALEVRPDFHLLATFAWMPAESRYAVLDQGVNILEYNVGIEAGVVKPLAGKWELKPFIGVGTGSRTYLFHGGGLSSKTCVAGYGAIGTEFQLSHAALRLEARDNVFCYRSPIEGVATRTRNEIGLGVGLAYHIR